MAQSKQILIRPAVRCFFALSILVMNLSSFAVASDLTGLDGLEGELTVSAPKAPTRGISNFDARIAKILTDNLQVAPSKVSDGAYLKDDLGADTFDIVAIVMDAEDLFNVDVGYDCVSERSTVKDLKACIKARLPKPSRAK